MNAKSFRTRYLIPLILIAALCSFGQVKAFDPGAPDSVLIDSVPAYVSTGAVVPIRFVNDEALSAIEVTFDVPKTAMNLDSFSFADGRVSYISTKGLIYNSDSTKATIYVQRFSEIAIAAGSGILGKAYFSWPPATSPQVVTLDSTRWMTPSLIEHYTFFYTTGLVEVLPQFKKGYIDIQADPLRPDSLWAVSTEGTTGQQVTVDLQMFNEKDLKAVGLALEWGTDRLTLDSISYVGTRGDAAISKTLSTNGAFHQLFAELEFADLAPLLPGTGIIGRLYFTIDAACPETTIVIDTTTFGFIQKTYFRLTSANGSIEFSPLYRSGTIDVKLGTGVDDGDNGSLPNAYALGQNFPNPFNPTTEIRFSLPRASHVRLDIYDIMGRNVRTVLDESRAAGTYQVTFDGRSSDGTTLATGIYFYRLTADSFSQSKKMLLLK